MLLGQFDEAYVSGTRAREIAARLGDVRLRLVATSFLEDVLLARGEYAWVVELATDNLAALPPDGTYLSSGESQPTVWDRGYLIQRLSWDRGFLIQSVAQLGRFVEASQYAPEAIRLAEPLRHRSAIGHVHLCAGWLHAGKGEWARASALIEHVVGRELCPPGASARRLPLPSFGVNPG